MQKQPSAFPGYASKFCREPTTCGGVYVPCMNLLTFQVELLWTIQVSVVPLFVKCCSFFLFEHYSKQKELGASLTLTTYHKLSVNAYRQDLHDKTASF